MPEIEQIRPFGPDSQLYDIRDNTKLPLGYGTALPTNADLDDYTTPGKYYSGASSTTATITHKPDDVTIGFSLYIFGEDLNGLIQIIVETVASNSYGKIYYRIRTSESSAFQDWRKVYTSTETVAVENGGTGSTTAADARAALEAAASLNLSAQSTWATLYPVLSTITAGRTVVFYCGGSTASLLTGGAVTESLKGTLSSLGNGTYDILAFSGTGANAGSLATWRITGLTSASATPTVNALTKYYGGTDATAARTALDAAASSHAHSQYYSSDTSRTKNTVLAAPNGSNGSADFRALVAADLPTIPIDKGGTGATTIPLAVKNLQLLGLGAAETSIPSHADYNSYAEPGIYSVSNNSVAATLAHRPTNIAGKLVVWSALARAGSPSQNWYYVLQAYTDYNGTTWIRSGGTESTTSVIWDSWYRVYDTSNPPTAAEVGAAAASHTHGQYFDNATSRTKNTVLAAPNGSNGAAAFRALVAADLPTVTIAKGGTGKTTAAEALAALGGISKKLLWTNSSPTSSMSGQTIAISNVSAYSEFEVYFMMSTSTQYAEARFFLYNVQGRAQMAGTGNGYVRDVKFTSSGMVITTGTSSSYVIPYKIYGIKGLT